MRQAVQCNVCLFLVVDNITLSCKTADLRATFIQTQNARQLPAVRSPNKVLLRAYRRMLLHNSRRSVVRLLQTLLVRNADLACVQLSTSSQMAVLSNAGAHCGVKECSRLDFLPFTCSCLTCNSAIHGPAQSRMRSTRNSHKPRSEASARVCFAWTTSALKLMRAGTLHVL